jgi:hypothetical protein
MKVAAIVIATLSLATAGAAAAQDQVSDQAFMKANRCKGLAMGLGADATTVKTFVKAQSRSRADMIIYRGQALAGDAQREAADPAKKEKLSAEFAADCSAFTGGASSVAARGSGAISTVR